MIAISRLTLALLLVISTVAFAADAPFDIVIVNGHIIDGTGSPWYSGDVGIRGGRIAAIGNLAAAPRKRTIDAKGMVVAPGFIDMLGQSETDDPGRSAPAFEDLSGHHHRDHRRRRIRCAVQRLR